MSATPVRRLAGILAADVVGYSRMMAADETGTLARVQAMLAEVARPAVAAEGGRIFKLAGDSFLAEFPSAAGAVACAEAVQRASAEREASSSEPLRLRIGVHLGDVIVEDGDLFGDGVNIAVRIEGLAEPGGISVSASVAEALRGTLPFAFVDTGAQRLKNIDRPVRILRLAGRDAAATRPLSLPDKPSLVVLPFENMSGDAEQDYFADGMVEDITTALSRMRWFFVIARNSAFTYKGRAVDVRQVGRELGVRYVLEGSVRRAGTRLRITGQLIEAETARHIWADRFDGTLDDVFDLQDRVTEAVAAAIEPSLRAAEIERTARKPTASHDAHDLYLRALPLIWRLERETSERALALLRQAVALDPHFARAQATGAWCQVIRFNQGWAATADILDGAAMARASLADAEDDPYVLARGAQALAVLAGDYLSSRDAVERALALCPNSAQVVTGAASYFSFACEPARAIPLFRTAIRLSPLDPQLGWMIGGQAMAELLAGDFTTALGSALRSLGLAPRWVLAHRVRIAALWQLGRQDEACEAAATLLALAPGTRADFGATYRVQTCVAALQATWRAAGLPG